MTIEQTLAEREDRYGAFVDHAHLAQHLTQVMRSTTRYEDLRSIHREALEMIQHKIARILNGDPDYTDNWHDIAGYATLVEQHLTKNFQPKLKPWDGTVQPTLWACNHGGVGKISRVEIGSACPVCFATHN